MSLYATPGLDHGEQYSPLVREVLALLAMAPRAGGATWGGEDLLSWVELTSRVELAEVESALTWVRLWGREPAAEARGRAAAGRARRRVGLLLREHGVPARGPRPDALTPGPG